MIASIFVSGGVDTLLNPGPKVAAAEDIAPKVRAQIPGLSEQDTETLVRINGAVQLGAGTLFAIGRFPRLSALALAASLLPTTAAGHRYWEVDDQGERQQQRIHFFKNVSMLGGLLLAALDTQGKPGLGWRARHGAEHAGAAVRRTRRGARLVGTAARSRAASGTRHTVSHAGSAVRHGRREARLAAKLARAKLASLTD